MKSFVYQFIVVLLVIFIIGCDRNKGLENSVDSINPKAEDILKGVFHDSTVQGLSYSTSTQSGVTNKNGEFLYVTGETVTFSIGKLLLGKSIGKKDITPMDLFSGTSNLDDTGVINILRLLQTLDEDDNPENGIVIPKETLSQAPNTTIDYRSSVIDNNQELKDFISSVKNSDEMVGANRARIHFQKTLKNLYGGQYIKVNVTGLNGTLGLKNNRDTLVFDGDSEKTFASLMKAGENYAVLVNQLPSGQNCSIQNGFSAIDSDDAVVNIVCEQNPNFISDEYQVSVAVSGLQGELQLLNQNENSLTITENGSKQFSILLNQDDVYQVSIQQQPQNQICTVSETESSGTINTENVTIPVNCVDIPKSEFNLSINVEGLKGSIELENNTLDVLSLSENGSATFSQTLSDNSSYAVTIKNQPAGQQCIVKNNAGNIVGEDINISVICTDINYKLSAAVSGLTGELKLHNQGRDILSITENGISEFSAAIHQNDEYHVGIQLQPDTQTCTISPVNAVGLVNADNVNVSVSCKENIEPVYSISVKISGLARELHLQNNNSDDLFIYSNATKQFATRLISGSGYEITVKNHPDGQTCTVDLNNNNGIISGSNVGPISVNCKDEQYSLGGEIIGLSGTLILENNGESLEITGAGTYKFNTSQLYQSNYSISLTHPANQFCKFNDSKLATGAFGTENISNVDLTCVDMFALRGKVSGLVDNLKVTLKEIKSNPDLSVDVTKNGDFQFESRVVQGSEYQIEAMPEQGLLCDTINNGLGTNISADVTNIEVICRLEPLRISEMIIPDGNLKSCITDAAKTNNWTYAIDVDVLDCSNRQISNLDGIQELSNLTELNINDNNIQDISYLQTLTDLTHLYIAENSITNILPLTNLTNLINLNVGATGYSGDVAGGGSLNSWPRVFVEDTQIVNGGERVLLTGLSSDDDGDPLSVGWRQTSGTRVNINTILTEIISIAGVNYIKDTVEFYAPRRPQPENLEFKFISDDYISETRTESTKVIVQPNSEPIALSDIVFADINLSNCITNIASQNNWQTNLDVTELRCIDQGIISLQGIEKLYNLEILDLSNNSLRIADNSPYGTVQFTWLDGLVALKELYLSGNIIKDLEYSYDPDFYYDDYGQTNAYLNFIEGLNNLIVLDVSSTEISNRQHLESLINKSANLQTVIAINTSINAVSATIVVDNLTTNSVSLSLPQNDSLNLTESYTLCYGKVISDCSSPLEGVNVISNVDSPITIKNLEYNQIYRFRVESHVIAANSNNVTGVPFSEIKVLTQGPWADLAGNGVYDIPSLDFPELPPTDQFTDLIIASVPFIDRTVGTTLNNKYFLFGVEGEEYLEFFPGPGWFPTSYSGLDIYDLQAKTWVTIDTPYSMLTGIFNANLIVKGDLIYLFNMGYDGLDVKVYDSLNLTASSWVSAESFLRTRTYYDSVIYGNDIILFGGKGNYGDTVQEIDVFDTTSNTWKTLGTLPSYRRDFSTILVENRVYVFGGYDTNGNILNTVDVMYMAEDSNGSLLVSWYADTPMPTGRANMDVILKDSLVYVIGGDDSTGLRSNDYVYEPIGASYSTITSIPEFDSQSKSYVSTDGNIYVTTNGGDYSYSASIENYVWIKQSGNWENLEGDNSSTFSIYTINLSQDGELYVALGSKEDTFLYIFDENGNPVFDPGVVGDGGYGTNAKYQQNLSAGTYEIIAKNLGNVSADYELVIRAPKGSILSPVIN